MRRLLSLLVLSLLALPLVSSAAAGQQPPAPSDEEEFRVRVRVERVTAPVVAKDSRGEFIYDLRREEVTVFDNGVPQQIMDFELASQPVSLVILVDTSNRVAPLLERVRKSGVLFTSYILGPEGEAAVVTFSGSINVEQDFTSDPDQIIRAVSNIKTTGLGTRLGDALNEAVNMLLNRPEGRRRVIIAITEPDDHGSKVPIGIPLRHAQLAEISVYALALSPIQADLVRKPVDAPVRPTPYPPGVFPTPGTPGQVQTPTTEMNRELARVDLLAAIRTLVTSLQNTRRENTLELFAQGTGALQYSGWSQSAFEQGLSEIGADLHNQYLISYRPSNRTQEGFHRIEVAVTRPGVTVRTRPGYFVGPPPEATQ